MLVVGDGCTDDSETVVARIGDPRVRWVNLPERFGHQSGPNNEGLRQAAGDLIAYLGHDDLWLPHHLSLLVTAIERSGDDMAHSLVARVYPNGDVRPATSGPDFGSWVPPSCTLHRRSVTQTIGGWRDYREIELTPEMDLWQRAGKAGLRFTTVPRLTAIKFPASLRRDVYRIRPCHEQAEWLARIRSEPDIEAVTLGRIIADGYDVRTMTYRKLASRFVTQTIARLRRRFAQRWMRVVFPSRKNPGLVAAQRFKGL
ncbi:MAG: hypothetical protein QOC81_3691 [Thermoanaerobaculia bacterium]|nr:hypothetical protein [Thermoanaerobaculia bacterium]